MCKQGWLDIENLKREIKIRDCKHHSLSRFEIESFRERLRSEPLLYLVACDSRKSRKRMSLKRTNVGTCLSSLVMTPRLPFFICKTISDQTPSRLAVS